MFDFYTSQGQLNKFENIHFFKVNNHCYMLTKQL